jgi:hypothetical protein
LSIGTGWAGGSSWASAGLIAFAEIFDLTLVSWHLLTMFRDFVPDTNRVETEFIHLGLELFGDAGDLLVDHGDHDHANEQCAD